MRRYIIAAAIGIPVLVMLFVGAGYAHDEVISADRVARSVSVLDTDVSRLRTDDVEGIVATYEQRLLSEPVTLIVDGKTVVLDPHDAGLAIDEAAVADEAMGANRTEGIVSGFATWVKSFSAGTTIGVPVAVDDAALAEVLDELTYTSVNQPAYDGGIEVQNGAIVAEYPQAGRRIDVEAAVPLVHAQLVKLDREPVTVPLQAIEPRITRADVDVALAEAKALTQEPVVLRVPGQPGQIVFTPAGLTSALRSEIVVHSPATIEVALDPATLTEIAAKSADQFAIPPVDASFELVEQPAEEGSDEVVKTLEIIPSVPGKVLDIASVPDSIVRAALGSGVATVPLVEGPEAEFTTEMAEAMGPLGEVSSFTTYHPCCQSRNTNINLLADEIRGAIVMPGEEFSVNDHAGKRTLEEGYVRAGAIINGRVECCDSVINIGGGTSQFATTFYNAVFFGCYEDVFHQPHSLYFSRYPYVREATLGFPLPDVIFRNDSDAVVYIDTVHTATSITVTFYGNNGGRTCTSERSGNTITRVMTHPDGSVTTESWTWNYKKPKPEEPDPTTTTTGATTTTLTPPSSSTTTTTTVAPPPSSSTTTTTPPETTTTLSPP